MWCATINGQLYRVQVKSSGVPSVPRGRRQTQPIYVFYVNRMGKGGKQVYKATDVDLFALVAVDLKLVAYVNHAESRQTMLFRVPSTTSPYVTPKVQTDRQQVLLLREQGLSHEAIAKRLNVASWTHRPSTKSKL